MAGGLGEGGQPPHASALRRVRRAHPSMRGRLQHYKCGARSTAKGGHGRACPPAHASLCALVPLQESRSGSLSNHTPSPCRPVLNLAAVPSAPEAPPLLGCAAVPTFSACGWHASPGRHSERHATLLAAVRSRPVPTLSSLTFRLCSWRRGQMSSPPFRTLTRRWWPRRRRQSCHPRPKSRSRCTAFASSPGRGGC